jgi:hypothetical protein
MRGRYEVRIRRDWPPMTRDTSKEAAFEPSREEKASVHILSTYGG